LAESLFVSAEFRAEGLSEAPKSAILFCMSRRAFPILNTTEVLFMALLLPHERYRRITDIPVGHFAALGKRALILDIDNTLTTHDNPVPGEGVTDWLAAVQAAGVRCILLSNNSAERVAPFAQVLGLGFEAKARKPFAGGCRRACRKMGVPIAETAMIGDQIFTDVLAGRFGGLYTILLDPIEPEHTWFFRLKRRLEQPLLRRFERRNRKKETT